ncbi:hypothetical protein BDN71DRAFT_431156 [Pleurotus eryngii]|uniref:Uncharacterized protein n=1 Tax=Pleurotus eryngii TaxID=5323 RepID=A0A9P6A384_PLEER|nr:hypothetical protein BDN71DRAFT_431156 [Pleurotus eryngii]
MQCQTNKSAWFSLHHQAPTALISPFSQGLVVPCTQIQAAWLALKLSLDSTVFVYCVPSVRSIKRLQMTVLFHAGLSAVYWDKMWKEFMTNSLVVDHQSVIHHHGEPPLARRRGYCLLTLDVDSPRWKALRKTTHTFPAPEAL